MLVAGKPKHYKQWKTIWKPVILKVLIETLNKNINNR